MQEESGSDGFFHPLPNTFTVNWMDRDGWIER
jgi:hypothetical protein